MIATKTWKESFQKLQNQLLMSVISVYPSDVPEEKMNETDASVKLTSNERKLSEICNILEPFEKAALLVQRERKNVSGMCLYL